MVRKHCLKRLVCASFLLAGLVAFGHTNTAFAQDEDGAVEELSRFDALIKRANEAYAAKDYDQAVRLFEAAHAIEPQANILYNIGLIHERAGNIKEAVSFFDRFLVSRDADSNFRRDALERRKLLGEILELQDNEKAKEEEKKRIAAEKKIKAEEKPKVEEPERDPGIGPWILTGAGGVSIVTSLVLLGATTSHSDTYSDTTASSSDRLDAKDSGETTALFSDITMGLGVASVAVGLVWYFVDVESYFASNTTNDAGTITPMISEDTSGVVWTLEFD